MRWCQVQMDGRVVYTDALRSLQDSLVRMAGTVHEMIRDATAALEEDGRERLAGLMKKEPIIDGFDRDIQERCIDLIATQAPMASDLRTIFGYLKIVTNLERIADYCVGIGKKLEFLLELPDGSELSRPISMGRRAEEMMAVAVRALADLDPDAADRIKEIDREMDDENDANFKAYTSGPASTPEHVKAIADLVLISRSYERIGDHIVNLARRLRYVATGTWDERRRPNEPLE